MGAIIPIDIIYSVELTGRESGHYDQPQRRRDYLERWRRDLRKRDLPRHALLRRLLSAAGVAPKPPSGESVTT